MGMPHHERNQVEGLTAPHERHGQGMTETQLSSRAILRMTSNPHSKVGKMQRLTSTRLLRSYPLGLRFSGKNMSPLPGWLAG
eukprot:3487568-Prymnesium_polylepis.1